MARKKPNVIIAYVDDLGYGDLSCYGGVGVKTPNIDSLLESGIKFTNGYSTSAVCTPARYSLLTGEYPLRNPNTYILPGDAACIIDKDKQTLPKVFKKAGYATSIVGKWHLGLGEGDLDWNEEISHTPNDIGFDYSFIFPATNDRVPCVYIRDRHVVNLDPEDPIEVSYELDNPFDGIVTSTKNPELLRMVHSHGHDNSIVNGVGRIGYMKGGESATWRDEDLAEDFLDEVKGFISRNTDNPFFVFYTLHQPHVPRVPNPRFVGASGLGPRGDVIAEMDWCIGELIDHLKEEGLYEDTIIIFSSDNGPVLDDGYKDDAKSLNDALSHRPAGPLRGGKYSRFDGGTRVPFIVSWPSSIDSQTSPALISQVDFLASFAEMLGVDIVNEDIDSTNMLDTLIGKSQRDRFEIFAEDIGKGYLLRQGKWNYLRPKEGPKVNVWTGTELGNSLDPQLYNMDYDIGQRDNVADLHEDRVRAMEARVLEILGEE